MVSTTIRRLGVLGTATAALAFVGAPGAAAHVGVSADDATEGSYSVLSFEVPHGCGESGTTELAIQLPDGVGSIAPTVAPGWEVETVMVELEEPIDDGHGGQATERVGEVRYRAEQDPLPAHLRQVFDVSVKLPEDAAGEVLVFPAIQTCDEGEEAWIQVADVGQDPGDLDAPAPTLEIAAAGDVNQAGAGAAEPADPRGQTQNGSTPGGEDAEDAGAVESGNLDTAGQGAEAPAMTYVALVVALTALGVGAVALLRGRSAH